MRRAFVVLLLLLAASSADAMFMRQATEQIPLKRLIANMQRTVADSPNDPQGHYLLGRLHALAYVYGLHWKEEVKSASDSEQHPALTRRARLPKRTEEVQPTGPRFELEAAIANLDIAAHLGPDDPVIALTRGWAYEARYRLDSEATDRAAALGSYRIAYAKGKPRQVRRFIGPGETPIDVEAAQRLQEMLRAGNRPNEAEELADVEAYLKASDALPFAVTPIVVALDGSRSLAAHIDPQAHVHFDLDALQRRQTWPWVRPNAGLLVWDPDHCGHIRDGEQLFGSVTWWAFWRDGYQPLAALDDNGDGTLTGPELDGLAIWIDANADGISDPGEVHPLSDLRVEAIQVMPVVQRDGTLWHPAGVVLTNGTTLPTFDWEPVSDPARAVSRRSSQ